ncbi:MAG: hypothetical protein AAFQ32_18255 [Pseudomonadota bacterium]
MDDIIKIVLGGIIGAVLGPILLEEYRNWKRERSWKRPRKILLRTMLEGTLKFRTLQTLSRTIGASDEDCRSLLVEIGARGARMKDGEEAWALISRAPLDDEFVFDEAAKLNDIPERTKG